MDTMQVMYTDVMSNKTGLLIINGLKSKRGSLAFLISSSEASINLSNRYPIILLYFQLL